MKTFVVIGGGSSLRNLISLILAQASVCVPAFELNAAASIPWLDAAWPAPRSWPNKEHAGQPVAVNTARSKLLRRSGRRHH